MKKARTKPSRVAGYKNLLIGITVVIGASFIFAFRNTAAFAIPNFYAEDATIFFNNIIKQNPIEAILSPFNGYLVVGQYLIGYAAMAINFIMGSDLVELPVSLAVAGCLFLGLTASLPYILFRKELGTWLSLLVVFFTAFVPMWSFDYVIIGPLGNLKFAFLYIAFMLLVYRLKPHSRLQYAIIDALLFLCVLTNVTVAFLLPVLLLPYIGKTYRWLRDRKKKFAITFDMLTGAGIVALSGLYVIAALLRGIPAIPGYLDGPFKSDAILPIIERTVFYAWTYPITSAFNNTFVAALLIATAAGFTALLWFRKQDRIVLLTAAWAIFLGTALFVINRPGIGDFYLNYLHKGGADQFFYAQNMIVIFVTGWLVREWFRKFNTAQWIFVGIGVTLYAMLALPHGTSFGKSRVVYEYLRPIDYNVAKACEEYGGQEKVIVQIYPSPVWQWQIDKDLACKK